MSEGRRRWVAKNLSIARGKLSLALGFARFTGAAKRHEWGGVVAEPRAGRGVSLEWRHATDF